MKKLEFYINIILSIIFITTFLVIFFFSYAQYIEENVITTQSKELVNYFTENLFSFLNPNQKQNIRNFLENINIPENNSYQESNKQTIKKTILFFSIFDGSLLIIALILSRFDKINLSHLLLKNIFLLIFVFLTEFLFLNLIVKEYISFDPNSLRYQTADSINKFYEINC